MYAPFIDHVLDFWNVRDDPNILFLFYEDMKKNLDQVVKNATKFLDKNVTQHQVDELCKHLSIDSMRANPSCNNDSLVEKAKTLNKKLTMNGNFRFIRKGEIGSFKEEFSTDTDKKFENFMQHPSLNSNKFSFKI
jgi:Sulfotransferase domain